VLSGQPWLAVLHPQVLSLVCAVHFLASVPIRLSVLAAVTSICRPVHLAMAKFADACNPPSVVLKTHAVGVVRAVTFSGMLCGVNVP
jgi:hypothetical protein